jgi:hypothetical protein
VLLTEGFGATAIYVDTDLGGITLHGNAYSVQEMVDDTNETK